MYMVWHADKYKITFKLVIDHWPRARYWAAAQQLRNTGLGYGLDDQVGGNDVIFPLDHHIQTGSGGPPSLLSKGYWRLLLRE
jgi:hypothetical protein